LTIEDFDLRFGEHFESHLLGNGLYEFLLRASQITLENVTELALGKTLLELQYILQVFCVRQEDGGGVKGGS